MKKVALIGNMNNNMFPVLRYLTSMGYDVSLLILKTDFQHFLPDSDSFQQEALKVTNVELSVYPSDFWNISKAEVRSILKPFDVLIGCGPAPAYCNVIGRSLDLFIPYGSDIYELPFFNRIKRFSKKNIKTNYFRYHQRQGIKKAKQILMDYTNKEYEAMFSRLEIAHKRYYNNAPFLYAKEFSPNNLDFLYAQSSFYAVFFKLRKENDFIIFQHGRQEWLDSGEVALNTQYHSKGNQKLIYAFADFLKTTQLKAHLILYKYGTSHKRSMVLVDELGINKNVTWMPQMPRKEILVGISLCDLGIGELDSSYFSYGAIYEFLTMGKPVIHYRDDILYKDYYPDLYPMYSANSQSQVLAYFKQYELNPESFKQTGREAHEWFLKNAIEKPLNIIKDIINGNDC